MSGAVGSVAPHEMLLAGILLPESVLSSDWFAVLAAFVAINTVMYVTLAVTESLPKIRVRDLLPRAYVRSETRRIHPDDAEPGPRSPGGSGRGDEGGSRPDAVDLHDRRGVFVRRAGMRGHPGSEL